MTDQRNTVQLSGHLGKDPEILRHHSGKLAKLTLITEDVYQNKKGILVKNTQWHKLCAWAEDAERAEKLLKKGASLCITGKLVHNCFQDRNGIQRNVTEVRVLDLKIIS
jgi:single-strand DNA-binding protein